jgi:hypothetical protein
MGSGLSELRGGSVLMKTTIKQQDLGPFQRKQKINKGTATVSTMA